MNRSNIFGAELKTRSSMSSYFKEIDSFPLLTREEEESLAKRYGDCCQKAVRDYPDAVLCPECASAKERLIVSNLRFVVSVAKKYQGHSLSLADLINEGNLGLIQAADKFDYRRGFHFISYAVWWVRQSILKAVSEKSRMIRLPMNRTNELLQILRYKESFIKEFGQAPSANDISAALGIPPSSVRKILECSGGYTALEDHIGEDGDTGSLFSGASTPEEQSSRIFLSEALYGIVNSLPKREGYIILKRYGLDSLDCQSLAQIGGDLRLTKERVRQLEKQAITRLRELAEEKQIPLFF